MNASAAATVSAVTMERTGTLTILRRLAEKDKTAVADCIDAYGDFIWALARKYTASREEAARATEEIFTDIWRCCEEGARDARSTEKNLIALIALRRLIKFSRQAERKSVTGTDAPSNEQRAGVNRISERV